MVGKRHLKVYCHIPSVTSAGCQPCISLQGSWATCHPALPWVLIQGESSKNPYIKVAEEIGVRRRIEFKSWNRKVKELVKESRRKVDEDFGIKLSEKFKKEREVQAMNVRIKKGWS